MPTATPEAASIFCSKAASDLAGVRNGILLFVQERRSCLELDASIRSLKNLRQNARDAGVEDVESRVLACVQFLEDLRNRDTVAVESMAGRALDLIAEVEAALLNKSLSDDEFWNGVSDVVDLSFGQLHSRPAGLQSEDMTDPEEFEVDEETLDIFRGEATELLNSIFTSIEDLVSSPDEHEALWQIRRCAHTLKGAAGIVGLKEVSKLAHRIEDLLDQLAEEKSAVNYSLISLLRRASELLRNASLEGISIANSSELSSLYAEFNEAFNKNLVEESAAISQPQLLTEPIAKETPTVTANEIRPPSLTVRLSTDRVEEFISVCREMEERYADFAARFSFLAKASNPGAADPAFTELTSSFETYNDVTRKMLTKLRQIRMINFGMLTTRLRRAINVTAVEENKKVDLVIENGEFEIDTQIMDGLVEPLLHLLRNSVVHGIEKPETRRLLGKPEIGVIKIRIDGTQNDIHMKIADDGRGISSMKLKEKAVATGLLSQERVRELTEAETFDLIFERGITTAESLSMNAGRGVGMSIVRETIRNLGGSITVESEPQLGTVFHIVTSAVYRPNKKEHNKKTSGIESPTAQTLPLSEMKILMVDDSQSIRQMTVKLLTKAGASVVACKDGREAVEFLRRIEPKPDIVLTDLEMPRMNGFELADEMNSDPVFRHIPIIMITSRTDGVHRKQAAELGIATYLTKPYDEKKLTDTIVGLVRKDA